MYMTSAEALQGHFNAASAWSPDVSSAPVSTVPPVVVPMGSTDTSAQSVTVAPASVQAITNAAPVWGQATVQQALSGVLGFIQSNPLVIFEAAALAFFLSYRGRR